MNHEIWALLWSKKQNCFHIEPASELCKKNGRAMHGESDLNDYHPVHIGSRQACDIFADLNRDLLVRRERRHA